MTRKTKKGIVGKKTPTMSQQYKEVGSGISFTEEGLRTSAEIEQTVKNKKQ